MKKLLLILLLIVAISCATPYDNVAYADNEELVHYTGNIEHIFTHCLLADPSFALSSNNSMSRDYARDCITTNEFKNMLDQLFGNGYILININNIFEEKEGKVKKKDLYLPKGKKPLIISFDDVNYDHKKLGHGMVDKIILTQAGELATYTERNNEDNRVSYDNEFIVILDKFVESHPTFSHNGAKGTICLTGYDGILGYRTQHKNPDYIQEIENVKPIVNKLKQNGWNFASHSYGHYHMNKLSISQFKEELELWKNEVEPIVGSTQVYVYPYGEWEVYKDGDISPKHRLLMQYGFKLFCGVGIKPFFSYLPTRCEEKVLFMDRTVIDGYSLTNKKAELSRLFSAEKVYDYNNRSNVPIAKY